MASRLAASPRVPAPRPRQPWRPWATDARWAGVRSWPTLHCPSCLRKPLPCRLFRASLPGFGRRQRRKSPDGGAPVLGWPGRSWPDSHARPTARGDNIGRGGSASQGDGFRLRHGIRCDCYRQPDVLPGAKAAPRPRRGRGLVERVLLRICGAGRVPRGPVRGPSGRRPLAGSACLTGRGRAARPWCHGSFPRSR